MKKFKRYIYSLFVVLIVYLIIALCVHFLSKGYTNDYSINKYDIREIYTKDEQDEHDNYYIEITANNVLFNYQFYKEIKDDNKLVKDIIFYDGEYKCLLPLLSDDIKVDFLCYKDSEYYNYQDIKGNDTKLDKYINNLDKDIYDQSIFNDKDEEKTDFEKLSFIKGNIPSDYVLSITDLKGVLTFNNNKINSYNLFDKDVYKRELSTFVNNYYVSANYGNKQEFSDVYVINLLNGKKKILKCPDYISFDSYIQGVVGEDVYIYDINNEKQYKINIKDSLVTLVGNEEKGIRYYNGNWDNISTIKANNKLLFNYHNTKENDYYYLYKYGNKLSGFYYYFYKTDDKYNIYRVNIQNTDLRKYLFSVKTKDDVTFIEDYVFYKDDNKIKMYSDYTGNRTLIINSELEYNENIDFSVYKK